MVFQQINWTVEYQNPVTQAFVVTGTQSALSLNFVFDFSGIADIVNNLNLPLTVRVTGIGYSTVIDDEGTNIVVSTQLPVRLAMYSHPIASPLNMPQARWTREFVYALTDDLWIVG